MSAAHQTALTTLARIAAEIRRGIDPEDRGHLAKLAREAVELLEQGADRRHMSTRALGERIAKLELQLSDRPAGERARAIRERLGLSRTAYYRARKIAGVPLKRDSDEV